MKTQTTRYSSPRVKSQLQENIQNLLIGWDDLNEAQLLLFMVGLESSQKQSELVIKEAEIKASEIIKKAKESANEIRDAVITLREEKDLIISKLRAMVNSQVNLFESKVQRVGDEQEKPKKQKAKDEFNVDVDDIVDKLL